MLINDLSYLENLPDVRTIFGGILVGVTADASAAGATAVTLGNTATTTRTLGNGGSIGIGRGTAIAIGVNPLAEVDVYGSGDKVIEKTRVHYFANKNAMVAKGFVIAIDRP